MARKVFIPLWGSEVAARMDLATEVWIGERSEQGMFLQERTVVLPQASAERLCHLLLTEGADMLICGAIEQEYYDYLVWKRIEVIDGVIGDLDQVRKVLEHGKLNSGMVLMKRNAEL